VKNTLPTPLKTDETLLDWLQLSRSENIGPLTFHRLLQRYKTPHKALEMVPELAAQGGLKRSLKLAPRQEVEQELLATRNFGADIITLEDPAYPPLLSHIDAPPPVLTIKGKSALLQNPLFAIVGARNASAMGKKLASHFAQALGQQSWVIVSGLARGIDRAAHEASLAEGTVAVLAGGIDQLYPPENKDLYERIGEKGVLIAESAFGVNPIASLFPRRNRIISGISRCILIVEAALKSGSLITARYAVEQGREVFAVPGHPLDPRTRGCNQLIKNGATLVETLEDIQGVMTPSFSLQGEEEKEDIPDSIVSSSIERVRNLLKENLSYVPISIDELIRECQLSASDVWGVLLEMEIAGRLERLSGGRVSLKQEWKSE
jgi:DNA processing protein